MGIYRHPILYLPIFGIPVLNNNSTSVHRKQLLEMSPRRSLGQSPNSNKNPTTHCNIRLSFRSVHIVDTLKSWHIASRRMPLIHECTPLIRMQMPLWDRQPKLLKFPYQSQLTILESWQCSARVSTFRPHHPPHSISYINTPISPFQRDRKSPKKP